jgi:hypothetical protein
MEPLGRKESLASVPKSNMETKSAEWQGKVFSKALKLLKHIIETIVAAWDAQSLHIEEVRTQRLINDVFKDLKKIDLSCNDLETSTIPYANATLRLVDKTLTKITTLFTVLSKGDESKRDKQVANQLMIQLDGCESELAILKADLSGQFHKNLTDLGFNIDDANQKKPKVFHDDLVAALKKAVNAPEEKTAKSPSIQDYIRGRTPPIAEELNRINGIADPIQRLKELTHMVVDNCKTFYKHDVGNDDVSSFLEAMMAICPEQSTNLILSGLCLDYANTVDRIVAMSDPYAVQKAKLETLRKSYTDKPTPENTGKIPALDEQIDRAAEAEGLIGMTAMTFMQLLGVAATLYNEARQS